MSGAPLPYHDPGARALATHCTEREDDATKVERRVRKSAAALLLSAGSGIIRLDRHRRVSEGHVGAALPASDRRKTGARVPGLDVGDHVHVRLIQTDIERGFIDFARA